MDRSENMKILRFAKKIKAINYLGGKCAECGEKNQFKLTFHHINMDEKEFEIADLDERRWSKLKSEIDKCELLCHNCHYKKHYDNRILKFGETRRTNKLIYLEYSSSICIKCGYNECPASLSFHHRNPSDKLFTIASIGRKINSVFELDEFIKNEIDKCDVLCSNCHALEHVDINFYEKHESIILDRVKNHREPQPKINRDLVLQLYESGMKQIEISKYFNTSKGTISDILKKYKAEKRGLDPQSI